MDFLKINGRNSELITLFQGIFDKYYHELDQIQIPIKKVIEVVSLYHQKPRAQTTEEFLNSREIRQIFEKPISPLDFVII